MTKQKFSAFEREAIWLAHSKKCAFTGNPIDISNFHIDHIIPESLKDDHAELQKIKSNLGLDDTFDICGFENLVPCNPVHNLRKGDDIIEEAFLRYLLSIAKSKKNYIIETIIKIKKRASKGKITILLHQQLENGKITRDDVSSMLESFDKDDESIFHLAKKLHISDTINVDTIKQSDIDQLMKMPIQFGNNDHIDKLTFVNDYDTKIHIHTYDEYENAINNGYYPLDNATIKLSSFAEHNFSLLKALKKARMPDISYIDKPRVSVTDLNLLPFKLFPYVGEDNKSGLSFDNVSYQDKINDGTLFIRKTTSNSIVIEEDEGMGQSLMEVSRADFSGDGLEDLFLFEYSYATHGTLGFGCTRILTRSSPDSMFETITY